MDALNCTNADFTPASYNALLVLGVRNSENDPANGTCFEVCDNELAEFFSVHGKTPDGDIEPLHDFLPTVGRIEANENASLMARELGLIVQQYA